MLKACDLRELIEEKQREYFQGSREWLFEAVREWLQEEDNDNNSQEEEKKTKDESKHKNKNNKRVFCLVGGAGTGKSVVSAQLLRTAGVQEYVKAWHFCRHDNAAGSDVRVILESWAAMLSALLPGFHVGDVSKALAATNVGEMFDLLIAEPFNKIQQQNDAALSPVSPCVLVLDAVDELPRGCLEAVLNLIANKFHDLPSFVKLFVASRNESHISSGLFSRFEPVQLLVEEVRNQADLRMYLAQVARRHVTLELSAEDLETQLEREFKLPPFRLRGELGGLDQLLRRSKDTYVAPIAKLEEGTNPEASHYRQLCGISDIISASGIKQCSGDLGQLYADARAAHHKLRQLFASEWREWKRVDHGKTVLSESVEGTTALWVDRVVDPGLKDIESARRKIQSDYNGDASQMKDLVRFTASFAGCARMKQFVEHLRVQAGFKVLALKNKYSSPTPLGYRDLNVTLQVELDGEGRFHVCELQVNLENMLVAKETAHHFYKEVRKKIPGLCKRAGVADAAKFESSLTKMLRSSVLETAVRELQDKAGGLFLYASLLARQLEGSSGKIDFTQLRGLPAGLSEVYQTNFERMIKSREDWHKYYSPLLALIVAAREPLPVTLAKEVMGAAAWSETLERELYVLFPVREGRFHVMHKSIADWLQDNEGSIEISNMDIQTSHRRLGRSLKHACARFPVAVIATDASFCVRHVVYHLCEAELWEELFEVVTDVKWLLARAEMGSLGVVRDLEHAASKLEAAEKKPHQATIKLMGQALRMDLGELQADYRSVPTRLVARLLGHTQSNEEVGRLLAKLREWEGPPQGWWCPSQPSYVPAGGPLQSTFHFPSVVRSVQWSPGNRFLVVASGEEISIWEVSSGECVRTLKGHSSVVNAVSWSNDGSRICSGNDDHTVRVWEVSTGACLQTLKGHSDAVNAVSWSNDEARICSGSDDHTVRVWEVSSGVCAQTLHLDTAYAVSWSNDGSRICSGSGDGTVRVWEVLSGKCVRILEGHSSFVYAVSWNNDDSRICSGSHDKTVRVWELSSGECVQILREHSSIVNGVSWSNDGNRICSGSHDRTVRVWKVSTGECIKTFEEHSSVVYAVSWSNDGNRICSGSHDRTVRVWEVSGGECARTLEGHSSFVYAVSWSNDGGRICSGSQDKTVRVWEVSSGQCIKTLKGHSSIVYVVSWSKDGSRICSGSGDHTARVWEVSSGECVQILRGHSSTVHAMSWSNDGTRICSGSRDGTVRVWELSSGECVRTLKGHSDIVKGVSWSEDDTRICSGGHDRAVRVWEVSSAECVKTLKGHSDTVHAVSWSNDGSRICGGGRDNTVRVWEVSSGECVQILRGHSSRVYAVSWSNDGTRICSGSHDRTVRLWEVSRAACLMVAADCSFECGLAFRHVALPVGVCARSSARLWLCPVRPGLAVEIEIEGASVHCLRRLGGPQANIKSWFDLCPQAPEDDVRLHT